jgi:hypothetical protein
MILTRSLALCILASALAAAAHSQNSINISRCPEGQVTSDGCIETKYDRFEDKTTVTLKMLMVDNGNQKIFASFPVTFKSNIPQIAAVAFASFDPEGYRYRVDTCALFILIDDHTRLGIDLAWLGNNPVAGWFGQSFGGPLRANDIKALGTGTKVEMKLCETPFALTSEQSHNLRAFFTGLWRGLP